MKTLKTLSDITRQELDRRRRDLNIFLDKKDELIAEKTALKEEFRKEQKIASESIEASFVYPNYATGVDIKEDNIDNFIEKVDEQIELMSEEIAKGFSELKKYEIMLERKELEELKEIEHKEQIELDEIGMTAHERKKESGAN